MGVPPSGPYLNVMTSQRAHLQIPFTLGLGASTYEFGGDVIQGITESHLQLTRVKTKVPLLKRFPEGTHQLGSNSE